MDKKLSMLVKNELKNKVIPNKKLKEEVIDKIKETPKFRRLIKHKTKHKPKFTPALRISEELEHL